VVHGLLRIFLLLCLFQPLFRLLNLFQTLLLLCQLLGNLVATY
jgi:hypothetical protein